MTAAVEPQPPDPRRSPAALAAAVTAVVEGAERRSVRVTAAIVAAAAAILGLLSGAVPALAFLARLPWWLPPALIAGSAALLVSVMPIVVLPRRVLDAWTTLTYFAIAGRRGWATRGEAFPEAGAVDAWLARHAGPEHALRRAEVLVAHGRSVSDTVPDEAAVAPDDRFLRAQLAWQAAFERGDEGRARIEEARLAALIAELPDGGRRAEWAAAARLTEATRALAHGADWIAPLADARRDLGELANGILLRRFVLPRLAYYGRISLAVFGLALLVNVVLSSALG